MGHELRRDTRRRAPHAAAAVRRRALHHRRSRTHGHRIVARFSARVARRPMASPAGVVAALHQLEQRSADLGDAVGAGQHQRAAECLLRAVDRAVRPHRTARASSRRAHRRRARHRLHRHGAAGLADRRRIRCDLHAAAAAAAESRQLRGVVAGYHLHAQPCRRCRPVRAAWPADAARRRMAGTCRTRGRRDCALALVAGGQRCAWLPGDREQRPGLRGLCLARAPCDAGADRHLQLCESGAHRRGWLPAARRAHACAAGCGCRGNPRRLY